MLSVIYETLSALLSYTIHLQVKVEYFDISVALSYAIGSVTACPSHASNASKLMNLGSHRFHHGL